MDIVGLASRHVAGKLMAVGFARDLWLCARGSAGLRDIVPSYTPKLYSSVYRIQGAVS